jgi:hypothetical protein
MTGARWSGWLGLTLLAASAAGCGQTNVEADVDFADLHPAIGRVVLDGQTLPGAAVRLHPAGAAPGQGDVYTGVVDRDGYFEVFAYRADGRGVGVPAGEYKVTVSWTGDPDEPSDVPRDERPELLPVKYTRPETSGLSVTVEPGENILPEVVLKK